MASEILVSIGSVIGLSPIQHQAISWTNTLLLSNAQLGINLELWNFNGNPNIFIQENVFEKSSTQSLKPQCINMTAHTSREDLRRWFLQQELDLFRYRFSQESSESTRRFLEMSNLDYKPVSWI